MKKKFQIAFDKTKKYAILNSCHASVMIISKNDDPEKSLKKNQTSLDKLKKYAILRTRCPLNGDDLKEKNIKNSEVKNF